MRINYCDGYFREGNNFFRHDYESGMDFIVSEDEAMAHKPSMLLDGDDNWNNAPWYAHNHDDNHETPSNEEVLTEYLKYNSYQNAIIKLEKVVNELEMNGNLDGVGAVYDVILWMKAQQEAVLRKLGIVF